MPTYINMLKYPLNLVGWQGSQVIEHAKALVGTVNTASLNLNSRERRSREFVLIFHALLHLDLSGGTLCLH